MSIATLVIAEALVSALADRAVGEIGKRLRRPKGATRIDTGGAKQALPQHLGLLNKWAAEVSFRDLWRSKTLQESFVNLDLSVGERLSHSEEQRSGKRVSDLPGLSGHLVLLGDPGAGKTTSLKKTAQIALNDASLQPNGGAPVLVRFRELSISETLTEKLLATIGALVLFEKGIGPGAQTSIRRQVLAVLLERFCSVVLLDGLDELHPRTREVVTDELRDLCLRLSRPKIILTCRSGDYQYHIEGTRVLQLEPLSQVQVSAFATKWLGAKAAGDFVKAVERSPYGGGAVRPLTLAHLCAIYERSGTVPEKPKTVYRKIVRLFLEEWDEQRSIRRYSRYANFEVDRKEEFLEALAFYIAKEYQSSTFGPRELQDAYKAIHTRFALPATEGGKVAREIESHTGLIVTVTRSQYEFAHKSIQEYLAGSYIAKLAAVPKNLLVTMPNEAAVAVALSSDPSSYFAKLVKRIELDSYENLQSSSLPFVSRLVLERVDWHPTRALGTAVLDLYTRTWYPNGRRANPQDAKTSSDPVAHLRSKDYGCMLSPIASFSDLLSDNSIAKSVAMVLEDSPVFETKDGTFVVADGARYRVQYEHIVDSNLLNSVRRFVSLESSRRIELRISRGADH